MLGWALFFLVLAIVSGLLGYGGVAGLAAAIAQALFFLFLVLFIVALLLGRRVFT
jgi:uncharacterized membrane protein YtjA (UPF0391 family)